HATRFSFTVCRMSHVASNSPLRHATCDLLRETVNCPGTLSNGYRLSGVLLARITVLDADRKILRVTARPEQHMHRAVFRRHIAGELAVEPQQVRQNRAGDRLPPLLARRFARRKF